MNIYIVCAWYEVAMRHYSFTILNNIRQFLPPEYKVNVTLVLRNNKDGYKELKELEELNIDYVIIKNKYLNIASKVFPFFFDKYVAKKAKEYDASIIYILFEGLFFNNIKEMQKQSKVLFTVHDLIPHEKNVVNWKEKWLAKTESERGKYLRENSDYNITNAYSQFIKLKAMFNKPAFYTSMPTLVNDHIANGRLKPSELNVNNYILFFGRIDKYKGLDQLIKCHLDSAIKATLVIAGAGNLWFKIPDSSGVIFINRYIDDEEFNYLFSNALMAVLPYKASTQTSLVSIPYYFQCPVMLSPITEFELLANNSGSIICDFDNPNDYSKYVDDISRDAVYKEAIISKQNKFYLENYDPNVFVANLKNIFNEIQQDK